MCHDGRYWREPAAEGRAEHVRSARVLQTSTCSAIASARARSRSRLNETPHGRPRFNVQRFGCRFYVDLRDVVPTHSNTASNILSGSRSPFVAASIIWNATSLVTGSDLSASLSD